MLKISAKLFFLTILFFSMLQRVNAGNITIYNSLNEKFTVKLLNVWRATIIPSFSEKTLNAGEKFIINMTGLEETSIDRRNGNAFLQIIRNSGEPSVCNFVMYTINNQVECDTLFNPNPRFYCDYTYDDKVNQITIMSHSH